MPYVRSRDTNAPHARLSAATAPHTSRPRTRHVARVLDSRVNEAEELSGPTVVDPPYTWEAFRSASQRFARSAAANYAPSEAPFFYLHSGASLELAVKSVLCKLNPILLVESQRVSDPALLRLAGIEPQPRAAASSGRRARDSAFPYTVGFRKAKERLDLIYGRDVLGVGADFDELSVPPEGLDELQHETYWRLAERNEESRQCPVCGSRGMSHVRAELRRELDVRGRPILVPGFVAIDFRCPICDLTLEDEQLVQAAKRFDAWEPEPEGLELDYWLEAFGPENLDNETLLALGFENASWTEDAATDDD